MLSQQGTDRGCPVQRFLSAAIAEFFRRDLCDHGNITGLRGAAAATRVPTTRRGCYDLKLLDTLWSVFMSFRSPRAL